MKKLLYIGHSFHNKTKSSQFLQILLTEKYQVTHFDFDPYTDNPDKFKQLNGNDFFDVVVLFQIMPSIHLLRQYVKCRQIVFFPMYDNVPNFNSSIWSEYTDCIIINFAKKLHNSCQEVGLTSFYIQYFPKPQKIINHGGEKKVFLWQRTNKINIKTIEKTLGNEVEHIYLHNAPDPKHKFVEPDGKWRQKSTVSTWFDTKEQMNNYLQECAIYYAPRKYEGIGMSFLEAMAVGRCVIAPNYPTMNEYITNGITGYLYNYKHPQKINLTNIRKIQENTLKYITDGYNEWEKNKYKILDWFEVDVKKYCNYQRQRNKLYIREPEKFKFLITWLVKKTTKAQSVYYLFGFIPIFIKKNAN